MALRSVFDPPDADGNDDLLCTDPSCQVCWLWPRMGEERGEWMARLATRLSARHPSVAGGPCWAADDALLERDTDRRGG